jgi:DNA-binding MarR family transcriptional regulator
VAEDEVDRLIARWRAERPDVDVSPLAVMSRVDRLARHLDRARKEAFAAAGLDPWEFDVLAALRRAGPPYELSPGTLVTSGTMTNRVDRLAARGLVERGPDPSDGRGVRVRLTRRGLAATDEALDDLLVSERAVLAGLGAGEADVLAGLLRRLLAPFDSSAGQPPA